MVDVRELVLRSTGKHVCSESLICLGAEFGYLRF